MLDSDPIRITVTLNANEKSASNKKSATPAAPKTAGEKKAGPGACQADTAKEIQAGASRQTDALGEASQASQTN